MWNVICVLVASIALSQSGYCPIPKSGILPGEIPFDIQPLPVKPPDKKGDANEPPRMSIKSDIPPTIGLPHDELLPQTMAECKSDAQRVVDYGPKRVFVPEAWAKDERTKGKGIKIAVLDTGCQIDHPWVKANIKGTYNAIKKTRDVTDNQGHGTHCASTITEALPDCELYIVKVLGDDGSGSVVDIAHGIDYAAKEFGVDVISMSLGGPGADSYMPPAIQRATELGAIIIAAAGNSGPRQNTDGYPARYPQCISVGATDQEDKIADFSSRGASLFVVTPGVKILGAYPGNRSARMSGTSMATPLMAALCGQWIATHPEVIKTRRPLAFRDDLKKACNLFPSRNNDYGFGLPDARKLIGTGHVEPKPPAPSPTVVRIGWADLTPAAQQRLTESGVTSFDLSIGNGAKPAVNAAPDAPKPIGKMPGFSWKYLPNVGWGWVQD